MSDVLQPSDFAAANKPLPTGINVLTILTFIGCALSVLGSFFMKWLMQFTLNLSNRAEVMEQMTEKQLTDLEKAKIIFEKYQANFIPILLVTIVGAGLCLYGALQMRKLQKTGFWMYIIGQVVPIIGGVIFLGFSNQFTNVSSYLMGIGLPALFIVLYALQLKHMK